MAWGFLCCQVLPFNVFSLPIKKDIIEPTLPDITLLRLTASLLPGKRNVELGGYMSATADWKWHIKYSVCNRATEHVHGLRELISHLNNDITNLNNNNTFVLFRVCLTLKGELGNSELTSNVCPKQSIWLFYSPIVLLKM